MWKEDIGTMEGEEEAGMMETGMMEEEVGLMEEIILYMEEEERTMLDPWEAFGEGDRRGVHPNVSWTQHWRGPHF